VRRAGASRPGRVLRTVGAGGAATLLTSWGLGKLVQGEPVTRPSHRLYEYCRAHRSEAVSRRLEQVVTTIGDYSVIGPFTALVGGMVAYERRDWTPLPLLAGGVVSEVYLQKALQRLVRGTLPPQESSIGPPGDFPSGGAARTVITFGLLAHMLTQRWGSPAERRVIWSIVALLVAAQGGSRLYLGRHWPEDVVGGWLFGWLILRTLTRVNELLSAGAET
jgi:membrane-associated phospholipid phosphatase